MRCSIASTLYFADKFRPDILHIPTDALLTFKYQIELMLEVLDQHTVVTLRLCEILHESATKSLYRLRYDFPNLS
jgi:hypothetical protein